MRGGLIAAALLGTSALAACAEDEAPPSDVSTADSDAEIRADVADIVVGDVYGGAPIGDAFGDVADVPDVIVGDVYGAPPVQDVGPSGDGQVDAGTDDTSSETPETSD